MRLRSCLMMVSMSFCLSLSVFLNWAKTLFFLLVSFILEMGCGWVSKNKQGRKKSQSEIKKDFKEINQGQIRINIYWAVHFMQSGKQVYEHAQNKHTSLLRSPIWEEKNLHCHMCISACIFFLYSLAEHWSVTTSRKFGGPADQTNPSRVLPHGQRETTRPGYLKRKGCP